jgi:signal transduction histidine kinase
MEAQGNDQRDTQSVDGFVINSRDVTQRKERQQQLSLLNRVLRHNLRNDLNVVLGEADTIHSRASGTVADSAGQIIQKGEELLQTAEVEREIVELLRKQPESRELAVRPLLGQIISTVASDHPEAVLDIDCPDGISIRATREFGEAVRELVTNAVEHNDDQSPEVTVTVEQRADTTRIEVADTGPRIPEMERDVLVGRGERTPLYHGTGLGLWFVELVVSRSGGTITFEENSPTGNIVGIELSE